MKKKSVSKRGAKMKKAQKGGAKKKYAVGNVGPANFFRTSQNSRMIIFAALFAVIGVAVLIRSFANPLYSSNPNEVVLEYVLPHQHVEDTTSIEDANFQPFTLYGNGLLVCGQHGNDQFAAPRTPHGEEGYHQTTPPTARVLNKTEMSTLIQSVRDTGFEQLAPEHYKIPVSQLLHTIRLVTKGVEKDVLYYNDVAPPVAYVKTLALMKASCDKTTAPYVSDKVTLRAKVDVTTKGQPVTTVEQIDAAAAPAVKNLLQKTKDSKRQNQAKAAANQEPDQGDEYREVISGQVAQDLQKLANGKSKRFVTQDGSTYEMGIDPVLPEVKNPLNVDVKKFRGQQDNNAKEDTSILSMLNLNHKASAAAVPTPEPIRVVLLLPASGGSTAKLDDAKERGDRARDWFCAQVGRCPKYIGVDVIRGSKSQDFYNTCREVNVCEGYRNQLLNVLQNVYDADQGTVYKEGVITLIVPGWKTNTLSTTGYKACGWGSLGGNLSAVDLYQTEPVNGYSCSHLTKSMAHEYAHNFALNHNSSCTYRNLLDGPPGCQYSNGCVIVGTTGPRCDLNSNQVSNLRGQLRHFPVPYTEVSGRVREVASDTGMANIKISTCVENRPTITTDSDGKFSMLLSDGTLFCLRIVNPPSTTLYKEIPNTNNQEEHANAKSYEFQVAGKACYHNTSCGINQQTWDKNVDYAYGFGYYPVDKK